MSEKIITTHKDGGGDGSAPPKADPASGNNTQNKPNNPANPANPQSKDQIANSDAAKAAEIEAIIKTYKLIPGDYRIMIKVYEASQLIPKKDNIGSKLFGGHGGQNKPYVRIEILDQMKKSKSNNETFNPVFNEQFFFVFPNMIKSQLEEASIVFTVFTDNGPLVHDEIIGSFELDITGVYFTLNHEYFETTLVLTDPSNEREGTMGLLKVTIEVLGPNDQPISNDLRTKSPGGSSGGKILAPAKIKQSGHIVDINLYRAEHLPIVDELGPGIDALITVKYAGTTKSTKVVKSLTPEWNENIKIACFLPNQCKAIDFELWDKNMLEKDELVASWKINFKDFQNTEIGPKWMNLYGPALGAPDCEEKKLMTEYGNDIGSHYRGRILYSIGSYDDGVPKSSVSALKFSFPDNPAPISQQKTYILRIDVLEASDLPQRHDAIFHFQIGPYMLKTSHHERRKMMNGRVQFYESLPEKKILMPINANEIPDLIVYFADAEKDERRHSFARIKAPTFVNVLDPQVLMVKLKEDKALNLITDDEFPGLLFIKVSLLGIHPKPRTLLDFKNMHFVKYQLRVFLISAAGLPSTDVEGSSDPFIVVKCAGQSAQSRVMPYTLNPRWYETLILEVELPPFEGNSEVPSGLSLLVYDDDSGTSSGDVKKSDLIGRSWINITSSYCFYQTTTGEQIKISYGKPGWHKIKYDAKDELCGEVLAGYALIPIEDAHKIPVDIIKPDSFEVDFKALCIGVRDLNPNLGHNFPFYLTVSFNVPGDDNLKIITDKKRVVNNGININQKLDFKIQLAKNKNIPPLLDIFLYSHQLTSINQSLIGYSSIDLSKYLGDAFNTILKNAIGAPIETNIDYPMTVNSRNASPDPKQITLNTSPNPKPISPDEINLKEITTNKANPNTTLNQSGSVHNENPSLVKSRSMKVNNTVVNPNTNSSPDGIPIITTFKISATDNFGKDLLNPEEDQEIKLSQLPPDNDVKTSKKKKKVNLKDKHHVKLDLKHDALKFGKTLSASVFGTDKFEYEDYDTDPEENLEVLPEWMIGREIHDKPLEEILKKDDAIASIEFKGGQSRTKSYGLDNNTDTTDEIAFLKMLFFVGDDEDDINKKIDEFSKLMNPKKYICRVYILEGEDVINDKNLGSKPDTYLVVKMGDQKFIDKPLTLRKDSEDPEYYVKYDFLIDMPGAPFLRLEVWQHHDLLKDEFIGFTEIDMEERHFNKTWNAYEKKPIEKRPLRAELSKGTFGNISLWVELIPQEQTRKAAYDISPPPRNEFELRAIIWETMDVPFKEKTTKCNDLFCRGRLGDKQEDTDTHWRCRAKGSFNWRMKFPIFLPLNPNKDYGMDVFKIQLFDHDIITANEIISEAEVNLNIHKLLHKAYKRKKPVQMRRKLKSNGPLSNDSKIIDRFWFDCFHPEVKDEDGNLLVQGKVLASFELVPKEEFKNRENGIGRGPPNNYPVLPEPVGRFSFDILNPLGTLKELLGPSLYRKIWMFICCLFCLVIGIAIAYFFVPAYIAVIAGKI